MSRLIGIDYGRKRTGIAVSDPLQLIAVPFKVMPTYKVLGFLRAYIEKENVEAIIVGWPLLLDGKKGESIRLVEQFIRLLQRHFPKTGVVRYDERFTSKMAHKSVAQGNLAKKKKRRTMHIDDISATFILRSFMESSLWKQARQFA